MTEIGFEDLAAGLRGWVRSGAAHEQAAVELLIWHETWLCHPDFRGACITQLAPKLIARISWYEAREFIDRGYAPERAAVACIFIAAGHPGPGRGARRGPVPPEWSRACA